MLPDLGEFHRIHDGEVFEILARGPSVHDYEPIPGAIVIGVNQHWFHGGARHDYGVFIDWPMCEILQDIPEEHRVDRYYITVDHPPKYTRPADVPIIYSDAVHVADYRNGHIHWDLRLRPQTWNWSTTFAMIVAIGMGASEIHTWGMDLAPEAMVTAEGRPSPYQWERDSLTDWLPRLVQASGVSVISHAPTFPSVYSAESFARATRRE